MTTQPAADEPNHLAAPAGEDRPVDEDQNPAAVTAGPVVPDPAIDDVPDPPDGAPPPDDAPPPGGNPPGGGPPPGAGAGFPPPGGFPPPPPGTGGWATRYGLVRPAQGRMLAGVCAAVGRSTNTDPVLWRVLFAVLALIGGVGLLAYVIGWLLIPGEGDTASPAEALLGRGRSSTSPILVLAAGVIAAVALSGLFDRGLRSAAILLALILGAILLLSRGGSGLPLPPPDAPVPPRGPGAPAGTPTAAAWPPGPAAVPTAPAGMPADPMPMAEPPGPPVTVPVPPRPAGPPVPAGPSWYRPPFAPHGPYAATSPYPGPAPAAPAPVVPPAPRRPPSRLGRTVFSLCLLVLGTLAVIHFVSGVDIPAMAYLATALAVIGLGLLVGTWFGRARWLIPIGLLLAVALAIGSAVPRLDVGPRGDDITWVPGSTSDVSDRYETRFGNATLDLSRVDFSNTDREVTVLVNVGNLTILLPPKVDTVIHATVNVGDGHVFGSHWSGVGSNQHDIIDNGPDGPGGGRLTLDITVDAGNLKVQR